MAKYWKGKKNCVKGFACGMTCINVDKVCWKELSDGSQRGLDRLSKARGGTISDRSRRYNPYQGMTNEQALAIMDKNYD